MNGNLEKINELEQRLKAKKVIALSCTVATLVVTLSVYFRICMNVMLVETADYVLFAVLLVAYGLFVFKHIKTKLAIEKEISALRES